jgi:hypothetical protein
LNISPKASTESSSVGAAPGATIGVVGALSIGIGGIIGGGFFATFGLGVVGARGSTYLSYVLGGFIALLTAYSYVRLTLRYAEPGGTVAFTRLAFGRGLIQCGVSRLLVLSYVAIMAIYALALASYSVSYLPPESRSFWLHIVASGAIVIIGLINFAGAALVAKSEDVFNIGKLAILGVFILGGFFLGSPDWSRLGTANWVATPTIVSSGMIVFLAYEGFELIANASNRIRNPQRTLPIAYYGSIVAAIVIYVLAIVVAIGHMPFSAMEEAQSFALSATAERFMGSFGFGLMTIGAILASASAINADFFGAAELPVMLAAHGEMVNAFDKRVWGRPVASMLLIGTMALIAVNLLDLNAISAATSGGFLIVYAAVNIANVKLADETKSHRWLSLAAAVACIVALAITLYDFASTPKTQASAVAIVAIVVLALAWGLAFRIFSRRA